MVNSHKIKKFINTLMKIVDTTPQLIVWKADIKTFCSMLSDWAKGNYRYVSRRTGVIVGICLAYVLSPIDIIPDFIPVLGQLDDISVIVFMLKTLKRELGFYRIWQAANKGEILKSEIVSNS